MLYQATKHYTTLQRYTATLQHTLSLCISTPPPPTHPLALRRAKAVVGADGYFSSVRRTLMPESRVPEFQDVIMYRAMVPPELGAEGGALRSRALRPPTTINDMVCLLYPVSDSETCWTISIKHSTM